MRRIAGACLVVGSVAGIWFPGTAVAVDATVTFDDLPPETTVTNQYANLGGPGQGVTFGPLPGAGGNGFRPVTKTAAPGQAHSGSQVADISVCNNGACGGFEFYPPGTTGTFQSPREHVSVRVGLDGPAVPDCSDPAFCSDVTLQAVNANGNPVGSPSSATVQRGAGFHTLLSVQDPAASIRGFRIAGASSNDNNEAVRIDDLTFDVPAGPAPPDFTLTPQNTFLVMSQGQTLRVPIAIGRTGGSAGGIDFSSAGPLPNGVSASFQPNPANGDVTDLVLSAQPDSATTGSGGFEPITLDVTGTPQAGAGPEARSFPISLQVREAFALTVEGPNDVDLSECVNRVPIQVRRDFGFPGPVSLSVDGLANGVQASFEPGQITFPNGAGAEEAHLVVTGPETGRPIPPTTLTIRAGAPGFPDRTATVTVRGTCPFQYDARVTTMEITQGVQTQVLPVRYDQFPASPIPYAEIPGAAPLRRDGPTIVRVYANLGFGPPEGVRNVPMVLNGSYRTDIGNLKAHDGSPISPVSGLRNLAVGPDLPPVNEVNSEIAVYTFVLPKSWTGRTLRLSARVLPSTGGSARAVRPCEATACVENDAFGIVGIPFGGTRNASVTPLDMQVNGVGQPANPATVFARLQMATPFDINVKPYAATIDITDEANDLAACVAAGRSGCGDTANSEAAQHVKDYNCGNTRSGRSWNMGINTGVARGLQSDHWCWSTLGVEETAIVERMRPLTSVGHEFGHLIGRVHASPGCGGNANGEVGEAWPPDEMGFLQSNGLTTTQGTGTAGGPFSVFAPPTQYFDYMSYCAGEGNAWISLRNWNRAFEEADFDRAGRAGDGPELPGIAHRPRGAAVDQLHVSGFASGDTASIVDVGPLEAPPQPPSDSSYRLLAFDAGGQVLADVAMIATPLHIDGGSPALELDAVVPPAGVTAVAIVRDGAVLDTRVQSASDPTVAVRGKPRFRRGEATVRWDAADPDGGELDATVEYSGDGGRTFEQIWSGASAGEAAVPAHYLPRSRDARLRVTINDGFREVSTTSKRFRSPGAPPDATILAPPSGTRQPNDAPLALSGQAYDDADEAITGRGLRWFSGKKQIGTGERISPAGLKPGRHRIELVARDGEGRTGRDSVNVRLAAAPPLFIDLGAPDSVKRKARTLQMRVAASQPAKLAVKGAGGTQRFEVGRRSRKVKLDIPRGRRDLELRLQLKAHGKKSTRVVSVERG